MPGVHEVQLENPQLANTPPGEASPRAQGPRLCEEIDGAHFRPHFQLSLPFRCGYSHRPLIPSSVRGRLSKSSLFRFGPTNLDEAQLFLCFCG